jgi:hypothetical protein
MMPSPLIQLFSIVILPFERFMDRLMRFPEITVPAAGLKLPLLIGPLYSGNEAQLSPCGARPTLVGVSSQPLRLVAGGLVGGGVVGGGVVVGALKVITFEPSVSVVNVALPDRVVLFGVTEANGPAALEAMSAYPMAITTRAAATAINLFRFDVLDLWE